MTTRVQQNLNSFTDISWVTLIVKYPPPLWTQTASGSNFGVCVLYNLSTHNTSLYIQTDDSNAPGHILLLCLTFTYIRHAPMLSTLDLRLCVRLVKLSLCARNIRSHTCGTAIWWSSSLGPDNPGWARDKCLLWHRGPGGSKERDCSGVGDRKWRGMSHVLGATYVSHPEVVRVPDRIPLCNRKMGKYEEK